MKNRHIFKSALFFATTVGGYHAGITLTTKEYERKLQDPQRAMGVVLENQDTWRPEYHLTSKGSPRHGAWITLFKPSSISTAVFIVFNNTSSNRTYILETLQHRVVDGKKTIVCEPPAGFFNGE